MTYFVIIHSLILITLIGNVFLWTRPIKDFWIKNIAWAIITVVSAFVYTQFCMEPTLEYIIFMSFEHPVILVLTPVLVCASITITSLLFYRGGKTK